jgi:hypothetical protein
MTADVDFCDVAEGVEVRDKESSESLAGAMESRRLTGDLAASRRGITISTCWQTIREGMNLLNEVLVRVRKVKALHRPCESVINAR